MKIDLQPGTYIIAGSGGVDSMVLLDILRQKKGVNLIVAHYDHGIRPESAIDRQLVAQVASQHGLSFVYDNGSLGAGASEDKARIARYKFLESVKVASGARAIVTAHHLDDAMETAILQILRGTGRRGLSSLASNNDIVRPLLLRSKADILAYANANGIVWNEDSTNKDTVYARNKVRHDIVPKFSAKNKEKIHKIIASAHQTNKEIDELLDLALHMQDSQTTLDRQWFISLPHNVSTELVAHWLRRQQIRGFNRRQLEKLVVSMKTLPKGHKIVVNKTHAVEIKSKILALITLER